jgi:hypothetical protein
MVLLVLFSGIKHHEHEVAAFCNSNHLTTTTLSMSRSLDDSRQVEKLVKRRRGGGN